MTSAITSPPSSAPLTPGFLRLAGACALLSALTTFLLWALRLGYAAPDGFDASVALHRDPFYLARYWTNFVHVFLALAAYAGAGLLLARRSAGTALLGLLSFAVWGTSELLGVSTILIAVNRTWRAGYAAADPAAQQTLRTLLVGFDAVWDAMFLLLLVAFLLGSLLYGLLAARGGGLERAVGVTFLLGVPLTLAILLSGYGGPTWLGTAAGWVYPVLQPVARAILGVWLWRAASAISLSANRAGAAASFARNSEGSRSSISMTTSPPSS